MIFIFSYQRKEMLTNLLSELEKHNPIIIDDGSNFKLELSNFHQFEHGGKENFYKLWQFAFRKAQQSNDDFYMFMPSDFSNIDLDRIYDYYNQLRHEPFVCNIINDNRKSCWGSYNPIKHNSELNRTFFTDCGFFCNRLALEKIDFHINEVHKSRFTRSNISSGVGQYLTYVLNKNNVRIYTPISSLAFHGEHESLMHPEERIKNPLISR
jgi:hypothetical protein